MSEQPDRDRAQDRIGSRKAARAETTESILADVEARLGAVEYPVRGEELSTEYAIDEVDLPNETESMGSVIDRLAGERFDTPEEAREAITGELTGEAGGPTEANPERDLERLDASASGSLAESGGDET